MTAQVQLLRNTSQAQTPQYRDLALDGAVVRYYLIKDYSLGINLIIEI